MAFHRADFQSVLLNHIGQRYSIRTSKRLASYRQSSSSSKPITLTFTDQTTATCDLLVGADGIHSAVRRTLLLDQAGAYAKRGHAIEAQSIANSIDPIWSGQTAFRAVIPVERVMNAFPGHRALNTPVQVSTPNYSALSFRLTSDHECPAVPWKGTREYQRISS